MSKLPILLTVAPIAVVVCSSFTSAMGQESKLCDPLGRLVSGLEVEADAELLCAGASLPPADEDTTVTAVCFSSNSVEELELEAGESVAVSELCRPTHLVIDCGDGICFVPRGEVAPITITLNGSPRVTLLDWSDIPGSHRYLIEVFDGSETIFTAQPKDSQVEIALALDGDEIVSVSAISPEHFILGYGSVSTADEDEG
ncbi:MAG: hypothetical protein AAGD25_29815 [Cyanobacteria bacterium P01_F01_bin.150]